MEAINEKALGVVPCFFISASRKGCIMTEKGDRQPIAEIIKVRKAKKERRLWQKR